METRDDRKRRDGLRDALQKWLHQGFKKASKGLDGVMILGLYDAGSRLWERGASLAADTADEVMMGGADTQEKLQERTPLKHVGEIKFWMIHLDWEVTNQCCAADKINNHPFSGSSLSSDQ